MDDLVSIITPSYNTEKFIEATIQSVLNQTYSNWEMIIVDDCSVDKTDKLVEQYTDSRIRYIKNEENKGAAYSRNLALREARGRWIAFLDSDDIWLPDKLEKQIDFMKENNYAFSYTLFRDITEQGEPTGYFWIGPKKITKTIMYLYNFIGCLTVMYDASVIGLIQIEHLQKRNDYALWLKVVEKAPCYLLEECLAEYRLRESGSITSRSSGMMGLIKYHYILYKEGEHMGDLKAFALTCINMVFGFIKFRTCKKKICN